MKFKAILSVSACLLAMMAVPTHAQISDQEKTIIASFAEPYGIEKGKQETIYIPPTAHITEMLIFFDESDDTINGLFFYYQPEFAVDPVRSHSVGRLEGRLFRIRMDRRDVINGLEVETSPGGALASLVLNTESGEKRGFKSTLANGESKQVFGNNLRFAGVTVRADKEKVYAMGLNLVPASASPATTAQNDSGVTVFSADGANAQTSSAGQAETAQPIPDQKTGFAKLLEDFKKGLELGRQERELEKAQAQSGITGSNVAAIHYDFRVSDGTKTQNFPGRLEITEKGSNIWNVYTTGQDAQKFTMVRRTNDIIIFNNESKLGRVELSFNLANNEVEIVLVRKNASGVLERTSVFGDNSTKGKIIYKEAANRSGAKTTSSGVTGNNVRGIAYEFQVGQLDLGGKIEKAERGSNIWNSHTSATGSQKLNLISRSNSTIVFKYIEDDSLISVNLLTNEVEFLKEIQNASGKIERHNAYPGKKGEVQYAWRLK